MKLLFYVLTTCCTLDVFSMSLPKVNKSEGLNEILKTLIKQAEGGLDTVKNIAKLNNGEKSKNDSTIIYIKTTAKPNTVMKHKSSRSKTNPVNYYNDFITEAPKIYEYPDDSGYPYNQSDLNQDEMSRTALNDNDFNQSVISEEIVFEINEKDKNPEENLFNKFGPEDQLLRMKSAAPTDDYPDGYSSPANDDMFNLQNVPEYNANFMSNFPGVMADPDINQENLKGTEEVVKEMISELSAIERMEDRIADLNQLVLDSKFSEIIKDLIKKITSEEINNRIDDLKNNSKTENLDEFDQKQSSGLFPLIKPRIRTVIHHQAYPLEQWLLGQRCCTFFTK